ncbi:HAD family hydrolase [Roseibium sediminicola]|uniref:HAD family hydrolase n=1 Tax=Roseibium sediminicola TaxID=2933272 RepID=A0ABT0H1Q8_9HYPH|nr:HAD family hydrolase [Roseibium sp. CAU 1639]MCK7615622.1 HAD family hydrolase [Roseibium sp. CAU 1639]
MTIYTCAVGTALLLVALLLQQAGFPPVAAAAPAVAAAFLMILRAYGVVLLPPRGDHSGIAEATGALGLALAAGAAWWTLAGPGTAVIVLATVMVLGWPHLIDGINAFADKVFHQAALGAGARDIAPDAFSKLARARDILIDKSAVMSGPDLMVTNVMAFNNEPKTLLAVAASAEGRSSHPVAEALRQLATQWHVDLKQPDRFEPAPGLGVVALLGGQTVVIGTTELLKKLKIDSFTADAIARSLEADGKTVLRVAVGGRVVGVLGLEGTLRQDAGVAGLALRKEGLVPWLNCGDSPKTREALAGMLGLEVLDDPRPGETAQAAAARAFPGGAPLVLTLSQDRRALELREGQASEKDGAPVSTPIALSDTDDIGAFPALKALAMRRNLLAVHARRLLCGLWLLGALGGALTVVPLSAAPVLFVVCLAILWAFARFSVADSLNGAHRPG